MSDQPMPLAPMTPKFTWSEGATRVRRSSVDAAARGMAPASDALAATAADCLMNVRRELDTAGRDARVCAVMTQNGRRTIRLGPQIVNAFRELERPARAG